MTGFNLPPGCNISDIPGNRPEDIEAEKVCAQCEYFQKCKDDPQYLDYCPLEKRANDKGETDGSNCSTKK